MATSARTTLLCGGISATMGGFYVLEGLGVFGRVTGAAAGDPAVVVCAGALFVAGGVAAMLTTLPGARARTAIQVLSLVIVACFAALFGWISIGAGERNFGGSLVIFGPRVNEIGGRIMFGLCALVCLASGMLMTGALARGVRAAPPGPPD